MDEKEILEYNGVTEVLEDAPDENIQEQFADTEISEEIQDDFVYNDDEDSEAEGDTVENKNGLVIQKPIIIACCILLCSIIAFGGFMAYSNFFGKTVIGTWVHESQVEADKATKDDKGNGVTYFTFERNGSAYATIGTTTISGAWAYNDEDRNKIDIDFQNEFITGTFTFSVDGNAFKGKNLKLKNEYASYNYMSSTIPPMNPEKDKNSSIDKKLIGSWYNADIGLMFTFNEDGTFKYQYNILSFDGVYTAKDGKFKISYITQETANTEFSYEFSNENTLMIDGLKFTKAE